MTETGRIIDMAKHSGWGDSVFWLNYEKRKVSGWLSSRPQVGDVILSPMQSGKTGRFIVTSVDYPNDPPDMFFAVVTDLGYQE